MTITTLSPAQSQAAIAAGARLVDIRGADEFARERIPGALSLPLDRIGELPCDGRPVVFHCRTGLRTAANAAVLAEAAGAVPVYLLDGGIDGWRQAGLATLADRRQPLELMRQVQIVAGSLVVLGIGLGLLVAPAFLALSGFIGLGLVFAGATGWCGMARLLRILPWNRRGIA